jgi:hypothetical protein
MRRREELKTREAASSTRDSRKEISPALAGISATKEWGIIKELRMRTRQGRKCQKRGRSTEV